MGKGFKKTEGQREFKGLGCISLRKQSCTQNNLFYNLETATEPQGTQGCAETTQQPTHQVTGKHSSLPC